MLRKLEKERERILEDVYNTVHTINDQIKNDVFDGRFEMEITKQSLEPYDDNSGIEAYFWIAFHDRKYPERDFEYVYTPHDIIYSGMFAGGRHMDSDLNKFIIESDFWKTYKANAES